MKSGQRENYSMPVKSDSNLLASDALCPRPPQKSSSFGIRFPDPMMFAFHFNSIELRNNDVRDNKYPVSSSHSFSIEY